MNEKMKMVAKRIGIIGLMIVILLACVLYTAAGQIGAIGSISVSSSPPGAYISLNGEPISAVTPYTIQHLDPASTYTIELSLEGYQDWSRSVRVTSGETSYVSATLTPIPPPPICTPYATKCIGNNLYRCSYDGSRWDFMQSCEYGCSGGACNPAPPRGYISVTSSPSGASIYLDGSYKGITPRTISDVSPGWHRIKLSLSGYRSRSKDVRACAGSTSSVDEILELIPSPGYISVSSSPSGAYIDLDGDYTGSIAPKTLSSVSPGTHIIRLRHTDYYDWTTTVDVASRGTSPVFATLTPISSPTLGSISVSSSPSGAYIKSLDGISYGGALKTPCTVPNVKPGTHVIELSLAGYEDWSTSVHVTAGETSDVHAIITCIVINEVELNPPEDDRRSTTMEWVELYNPTSNDINLGGWRLSSTQAHGGETINLFGTIKANGYRVFERSRWLHNTRGESVILRDANDIEIDQTPRKNDDKDDYRSWQRCPNGIDTNSYSDWKFRLSTKRYSNNCS